MKNNRDLRLKKHPVLNLLIVLLSFLVIVFMTKPTEEYASSVYTVGVIIFIIILACYKQFGGIFRFNSFYLTIPSFLVCICNIPIFSKYVSSVSDAVTPFDYYLECFPLISILKLAFIEEVVFRLFFYKIILHLFGERKNRVLYTVLITSGAFALAHLLNLFNGYSLPEVVFQATYCFFLGAMFQIAYIITKGIYAPVLMHFIFNMGDFFATEFTITPFWNAPQFVLMIVFSVIAIIFNVYYLIKINKATS